MVKYLLWANAEVRRVQSPAEDSASLSVLQRVESLTVMCLVPRLSWPDPSFGVQLSCKSILVQVLERSTLAGLCSLSAVISTRTTQA